MRGSRVESFFAKWQQLDAPRRCWRRQLVGGDAGNAAADMTVIVFVINVKWFTACAHAMLLLVVVVIR